MPQSERGGANRPHPVTSCVPLRAQVLGKYKQQTTHRSGYKQRRLVQGPGASTALHCVLEGLFYASSNLNWLRFLLITSDKL